MQKKNERGKEETRDNEDRFADGDCETKARGTATKVKEKP